MTPSTIKLFLPFGDPSELRIAEISNWSGKAIACPRTSLEELFKRSELDQPGVYLLLGEHPDHEQPMVYIGEAETLRKRLRSTKHKQREFWTQVIVLFSKDDALSKAHIKYLEGQLLAIATEVGKADLDNDVNSGAKLSESDIADMEVFLGKVLQLLPVLGTTAFQQSVEAKREPRDRYTGSIKGLLATGRPTANGFMVYAGSQAVSELRQSARNGKRQRTAKSRERLLSKGILAPDPADGACMVFTKDHEFTSPSAAGVAICGGATNGLTFWKDAQGVPLKERL